MLVVPWSHDQPDNAARVTRLGVARTIPKNEYTSTRATTELQLLLNNQSYKNKAIEIGKLVQSENGIKTACDSIEKMLCN